MTNTKNNENLTNSIQLAKRINNTKRSYLLVNTHQAKHTPISPTVAFSMMQRLGKKVSEKCSKSCLVIGFAETATAIGAVVASCISNDCMYIQTTRETYSPETEQILFYEEHSHAKEQKLLVRFFSESLKNIDTIIFVDDEITTGKTLLNIVTQLKTHYAEFNKKRIIVASIINRMSSNSINILKKERVEFIYLNKLPYKEYLDFSSSITVTEPVSLYKSFTNRTKYNSININMQDPRKGLYIHEYFDSCETIYQKIKSYITPASIRILILGTEECMLPAILVGKRIQEEFNDKKVFCHATTRSPIGINKDTSYPINSGYILHSFYDDERTTYLYNLKAYDLALIITDSQYNAIKAKDDFCQVLHKNNCENILFITR